MHVHAQSKRWAKSHNGGDDRQLVRKGGTDNTDPHVVHFTERVRIVQINMRGRVLAVWTHTPGGKGEFYKNGRSVCNT